MVVLNHKYESLKRGLALKRINLVQNTWLTGAGHLDFHLLI